MENEGMNALVASAMRVSSTLESGEAIFIGLAVLAMAVVLLAAKDWFRSSDRKVRLTERGIKSAKKTLEVLTQEKERIQEELDGFFMKEAEAEAALAVATKLNDEANMAHQDRLVTEAKVKETKAKKWAERRTAVKSGLLAVKNAVSAVVRKAWFKAVRTAGLVSIKELEVILALQEKLDIARLQISCLSDKQTSMEMKMHDLEEELSRKNNVDTHSNALDMFKVALEAEEKEVKALREQLKAKEAAGAVLKKGFTLHFDVSEAVTLGAVRDAVLRNANLSCSNKVFGKVRKKYSGPRVGGNGGGSKSASWKVILENAEQREEMDIPISRLVADPVIMRQKV